MQTSFEVFSIIMLIALAKTTDEVEFEGLRLDFSALTLNRDILSSIIPALNRTRDATFPTIQESGSFFSHLTLSNIKITYYNIFEERFDMSKFEYYNPVYRLHGYGDSIVFHISFDFHETWVGMPISSGKVLQL